MSRRRDLHGSGAVPGAKIIAKSLKADNADALVKFILRDFKIKPLYPNCKKCQEGR